MTPKSAAIVACRLLAIWFFVQAARSFPNYINTYVAFSRISPGTLTWTNGASLGATLTVDVGASFVLWLGAAVLAGNMTRGIETTTSKQSEMGIVGWQAVGFSLIGLFLTVQGFSVLAGLLGLKAVLASAPWNSLFQSKAVSWPQIATAVAQFIVGLILLLWAQKTIRVLDYLQRGGHDGSSND